MMSKKMRSVIVGIDGSDGARAATQWAAALARRYGAPMHLVHALPEAGLAISEAGAALRAAAITDDREHAAQYLADAKEAAHAVFPELSVSTVSLDSPAAEALIDASWYGSFVVLAGEPVTPAAALLLGSTTLAIATHAGCPVIRWRPGHAAPDTGPVVVGVDYTATGQAALTSAFEVADRLGLGVKAVRAWTQRRPGGDVTIPVLIDWDALEAAEFAFLTDTVDKIACLHPHVEVKCYLEKQSPAPALLGHSADAAMVVVGTRGRGRLAGTLLGSTSLKLLHHSSVPVMICRDLGGDG